MDVLRKFPGKSRMRILLIDDDANARLHVRHLLQQVGAEVDLLEAATDAVALAHAATMPFECVLLDYMCTGGPSTDVLPRLMRLLPDAAFVVLTAQGDESVAVELMKRGATDYLPKEGLSARTLWRSINAAVAVCVSERVVRDADEQRLEHAEKMQKLVSATPSIARAKDFAELARIASDRARDILGVKAAFVSLQAGAGVIYNLSLSDTAPADLSDPDQWARAGLGAEGATEVVRANLGELQPIWVVALRGRDGASLGCIATLAPLGESSAARLGESLLLELALIIGVTRDHLALYIAATRAVQAREDVLAVVCHDLRGPLGNMSLGMSLLQDALRPADRNVLQRVERSLSHMTGLVDELVDMVRVEGQGLDVTCDEVDTRDMVDTTLSLVAPLADARGIVCEMHLDARAVHVYADRHRVVQVLSNLLGNAIKFTPPGGRVDVYVEALPDCVRFCVSDSGKGVEASERERVFERFWRSDGAKKRGLGLGLFIAKGIVEAHGGRIWCEDAPGQGASFVFTLPHAVSTAPLQSSDAEVAVPMVVVQPQPSWLALVADDDDDMRALVSVALLRAGFEVLEVPNGRLLVEAFEALSEGDRARALVISDIGMPEMDGIAATRVLRAQSPGLPILLITAFADRSTCARARAAGATEVSFKPLDLEAVVRQARWWTQTESHERGDMIAPSAARVFRP